MNTEQVALYRMYTGYTGSTDDRVEGSQIHAKCAKSCYGLIVV